MQGYCGAISTRETTRSVTERRKRLSAYGRPSGDVRASGSGLDDINDFEFRFFHPQDLVADPALSPRLTEAPGTLSERHILGSRKAKQGNLGSSYELVQRRRAAGTCSLQGHSPQPHKRGLKGPFCFGGIDDRRQNQNLSRS